MKRPLTSRLVDVALYHNLDLLHVHYAIPHASAAYFAQSILRDKGKDLPFVTTLHGTDITLVGKAPSYQSVVEFSINSSNAVTAVSESLKQDTLNNFAINRSIEVIPNFIDTIDLTLSKTVIQDRPISQRVFKCSSMLQIFESQTCGRCTRCILLSAAIPSGKIGFDWRWSGACSYGDIKSSTGAG